MDEFYIPTYDEYKQSKKKYTGEITCGVPGCENPGLYEGGDYRCWFPICEEHGRIREYYENHVDYIKHRIRIRNLWTKQGVTTNERKTL